MDFAIPGDPRMKIKESEKRDKYLDLAREQKNHEKMTVILIVNDVLRTLPKGDWMT